MTTALTTTPDTPIRAARTARRRGRSKIVGFLGIAIFITIVIVTGLGLASTQNLENPFTVFSQVFNTSGSMGQERPAMSSAQPPAGGRGERGATTSTFQIGGVLFNLWYLCATTAVVIVLQRVLGIVLKLIRPKRLRPALAP